MKVRTTKGASFTEYAILLGLIGIVGIFAVFGLGQNVQSVFGNVANAVDTPNGPGNGNNGAGPGGGSAGVTPPDESTLACITDEPGFDAMQENGGYTFPGDCLLVTTDGDVSFLVDEAINGGGSYYVRVNDSSGNFNDIAFVGGADHTVVHEAGNAFITFEGSNGQVWAQGISLAATEMAFSNQRDIKVK